MIRRLMWAMAGGLLLPGVWGVGKALYHLLVRAQVRGAGNGLLGGFFLGAGGWVLLFLFLTRPMRSYVLAHELSHALAAWFSGARVSRLRVRADGGSVDVSRTSVWIALAPYLIPFYSLLLLVAHAVAQLFWDPAAWIGFLPFGLGLTWSFHLTFTIYALSLGQSDIAPYGALGAYPLILFGNLLLLALALVSLDDSPLAAVAMLGNEFLRAYGRVLGCLLNG